MLKMEDCSVLDMYFEADHEVAIGVNSIIPLCRGGGERLVTNENRREFVALYTNFKLRFRTRRQVNEIRRGFNSVIPLRYLSAFSPRELTLLFCGSEKLCVSDWEANTAYAGGYTARCVEVRWFWAILRSFTAAQRLAIFQFTTALSRVGEGGFKDLQLMCGHLFTLNRVTDVHRMPNAHTCFNTLDLPCYPTRATMKRMLLLTVEYGNGAEFAVA